MSYADDFNNELHSIESRFAGGLSNTSTKKFDNLIKIVADFTQLEEEKIYITAATSRASNLWNRLAQGKPLTQHFSFALGIIDAEDLQGGISPASRFIGPGVGHYDAIALAVRRDDKWVIGAVLDSDRLPIYDRIATAFPDVEITHEVQNIPIDNTDLLFAWYVGTTGNNADGQWTDFSDEYIDNGIWVNGWDDKFIDVVKSIAVGDRIAIKSTFTQKKNLPFDNHGKTVGAMRIKAIGTVTENAGDGKTIKVDWTRLDPFKTWFGPGVLREAIHRVDASDGYIKKQLLAFTFGDEEQDYSLCEEKYSDDIDQTAGVDEMPDDAVEDDMDVATSTGDSETAKKKTCLEVVRTPRVNLIHPLNFIIYGAPGTGKTYSTAEYALAIIENRAVDTRRKSYEKRKAVMAVYNDYVRKGQIVFTTFHQSYGYEEFIQGLRPDTKSGKMAFITVDGVFKRIADDALDNHEKNYVIIIDEINRANISKVFGELITLIESDKRWGEVNETCTTLQSGDIFAVPNNLYIVGTMNSADKSISLIDAALRRRFEFIEQYPNASLVDDPTLRNVLSKINTILADSLESSDLLIGHSYFMGKTVDDLCAILNNSIIPLLYEYYYDNKKKVIGVLTDALKDLGIKIVDDKISRVRVEKADVQE